MLNSAILTLALTVGQTGMTSSAEDFQEYGKLAVGRWSGEITLIANWPGLKKKAGEKLVNYVTTTWIADKKGLLDVGVGGETTGTSLIVFDPVAREIRYRNIDSAGGSSDLTIWKISPKKWGWKVTGGGLPDGKKLGGTGSTTFSEDGRTQVIEGDVTIDGQPTPHRLKDTYTRLD